MNTLILLIDGNAVWSPEHWVLGRGGVVATTGQAVVEDDSGWLSVFRDDTVLQDYEASELDVVSTLVSHPLLFLIQWRGNRLVEELLRAVPAECTVVVDNDHGVLAPVERVRDHPLDTWMRARTLP